MTTLDQLNRMGDDALHATLRTVCGSTHWVREMSGRRPFDSVEDLEAEAERAADALTRDDWLEAFAAHPRIGDRAVLAAKVAGWAGGEQGGVDDADNDLIDRLEAGNRDYEQKFGFIFLVNATGKTGPQMLELLEQRLSNEPDEEWRVAAGEQRQITRLRLRKLIDGD